MNTHNSNPDPNTTIPNLGSDDPYRMSFAELAVQLSITQSGTARAQQMEHEIRRRLAIEAAGLMRFQIAVGIVIGGLIAMMSFSMGIAVSRNVPPHQHRVESPTAGALASSPPPFRRS
jgi:hypothetical protein